jgi:hypothetical protein
VNEPSEEVSAKVQVVVGEPAIKVRVKVTRRGALRLVQGSNELQVKVPRRDYLGIPMLTSTTVKDLSSCTLLRLTAVVTR